MKPSEFLRELEKIRPWLEAESKNLPNSYREYLGFYPFISDTDRFKALKQGYWSSFFFASLIEEVNISSRIFPAIRFEDWPIYQSQRGSYSYTFCNLLSNFVAFSQVGMLLRKDSFPFISEDWDVLMKLAYPLLKLFKGNDEMEYIKEYAFDSNNQPVSNAPKDNLLNYLDFWFHYDKSPEHAILREIISQLNNDKKWLPDNLPNEDLGIWETRIKNLLMSRAKSNRVIYGNERVKEFIIEGFLQPHGYDAEDILFSHYPISNMSKISINAVVGYFNLVPELLPESFRDSHLYNAALEIDNNFNGYRGEQHYQAALVLESENKPLEAWNALVSASYWAGVNGDSDGVEKHWQKAIEICEKQNWNDAHDALSTQWEWYQDYKSKNQ